MKPSIEVEAVGKKYCRSLKRSMRYGLADVTRELMGLPVNSSNLRPDEFWAFEEVSFRVQPGECLGLIGSNGAGKSTLLKLLAGIFPPDHGHIRIQGKVSSLIEVGAGFHPLLSGRENVYINGSILGMSSNDIDAHLDEIIEFSGVGDFIDSPVKHYSSGMYVRLGFSIAAHSNPDVLLVDEALAVGDMAFNIKCLNRIAEMRGQGVSVVFVSHNELQVREAADRCLLLSQGRVVYQGDVDTAFQHYELHEADDENDSSAGIQSFGSSVDIRDFAMTLTDGSDLLLSGEDAWVKMAFHCSKNERGVYVELRIWDQDGTLLGTVDSRNLGRDIHLAEGDSELHLTIRNLPLAPGSYRIAAGMRRDGEVLGWAKEVSRVVVSVPDGLRVGAGKVVLQADGLEVVRQEHERGVGVNLLHSE